MNTIHRCSILILSVCAYSFAAAPEIENQLVKANQLRLQGSLAESEIQYREAIAKAERVGVDDELLGKAMNNLGALLYEEAKFKESETWYLRALEARARVAGPDGVNAVATLTNLSELYRRMGRLKEAEEIDRNCGKDIRAGRSPPRL
jgi:Tfp pilus assembly protein PilF